METLFKILLGILAIILIVLLVVFFVPIVCFIFALFIKFWWVVLLGGIFVMMTVLG